MGLTQNVLFFIFFQGLNKGAYSQQWRFFFPSVIEALEGSCVEIPCTFTHPTIPIKPSVVWYMYDRYKYIEIFNSKDSSAVLRNYRSRTSLVTKTRTSCTLRIDKVTQDDKDYYYPGIAEHVQINAFDTQRIYLQLQVIDSPNKPKLQGSNVMTEGKQVVISCIVEHTCGSSPPSLQWNMEGHSVKQTEEPFKEGIWRSVSELTYLPSYEDDRKQIECTATYPNKQKTSGAAILNIEYPPKDTKVIITEKELKEGDEVTLSCSSKSKTDIHAYEWHRGKEEITLFAQTKQIIVKNVSWISETYTCSAVNSVGKGVSDLTEIPVQYSPKEVLLSKLHETEEFTDLKCEFLSSRPNVTHYTWLRNEDSLINQTQQVLRVEMSGRYSCSAHNKIGNTTSSEVLIVVKGEENRASEVTDLPVILGCLAAGIALILAILVIFFYIRMKNKSDSPSSPIHGVINKRMTNEPLNNEEYASIDGHIYGNLQDEKSSKPNSSYSNGKQYYLSEEDMIYSNAQYVDPEDVQYSAIQHNQHIHPKRSTVLLHKDDIDYAVVIQNNK
ncbi:B-cell receptor CD22 isoform X1 [Bombina bombina]|uniref:B-cell receptor CD22 isoform X1 n=1 Tax=Bombina bombina TaxID=8345 RepID=UPI00235B1181|nr:B-cell receptor CD22 isoform X1 [Bombina bombina]